MPCGSPPPPRRTNAPAPKKAGPSLRIPGIPALAQVLPRLGGLLALTGVAVATAPVPAPGTAVMTLSSGGQEGAIEVSLRASAATLSGLAQAPSAAREPAAWQRAAEAMANGSVLLRFSAQADCHLAAARVDRGGLTDAIPTLAATYRFACAHPEQLDSAAMGLFAVFSGIRRVLVRYDLAGVRGEDALNLGRPVVSFVPLY